RVSKVYSQLLSQHSINIPYVEEHNISTWAQFTVRVKNRKSVQQKMDVAAIPTAVHYPIPLNKQPAVADPYVLLPVGDKVAAEVMSLPMHPYLTEEEIARISGALLE